MHWSDRDFEEEELPRFRMEPKHSGFGIASLALSLVLGLLLFLLVVVAVVLEETTPGGIDEKSPVVILLGLAMFASGFFDLVALVLGVVGLFQQHRKKVFAILGVIFSAGVLLVFFLLMVIGLLAG